MGFGNLEDEFWLGNASVRLPLECGSGSWSSLPPLCPSGVISSPVSAEKLTAYELLSVPLALFGRTIDLFLSHGRVFLFALSLPILINSLLC